MSSSGGKGRFKGGRSGGQRRGVQAGHSPQSRNGIPTVFHEMLDEVLRHDEDNASKTSRPIKRRKTTLKENNSPESNLKTETDAKQPNPSDLKRSPTKTSGSSASKTKIATSQDHINIDAGGHQNVYSIEYEESEESGLDWEEVNLQQDQDSDPEPSPSNSTIHDVDIVMHDTPTKPDEVKRGQRKGITAEERKKRLDIHKLHLLCLLYHGYIRNKWCNDGEVQAILKKLVQPRIITSLNPDPAFSQFQAAEIFTKGLLHAKTIWNENFTTEAYGMYKPRWAAHQIDLQNYVLLDHSDPPMTLNMFRNVASTRKGSQDIGAQLFCALLRSVGVEARLVCSLQCLPFTAIAVVPRHKAEDNKRTVHLDSTGRPSEGHGSSSETIPPYQRLNAAPTRLKRITQIGRSSLAGCSDIDKGKAPQLRVAHTRPNIRPQYPVFWVEAFNAAHQKWITVDPLATFTVDKPSKLEPPLHFEKNVLSYVVSFESDGTAKDVTRRYAKAYNAKTRKLRVENTEGGEGWWKKTLRVFKRHRPTNRDQLEDASLSRKEAAEGLPRNVQDFKNHPLYILERHLKHNEVIHPKNEVGKVNIGSSASDNLESVYRRKDLHTVRTADRWYRLGREVKFGEQPLKNATRPKTAKQHIAEGADSESEIAVGKPLYAAYQTEMYVPPPVVRGRIPKNAFGNLDIYVPSMIPAGGVHIGEREASRAARLLGIDYADAVTGFQFRGKQGSAVIEGCVVAAEYADAIRATIDGMAYLNEETQINKRRVEALRLWKRFFIGVKIVERVKLYAKDDEQKDVQQQLDEVKTRQDQYEEEAGGFLMDDDGHDAMPTAASFSRKDIDIEEFEGGFLSDDNGDDEVGDTGRKYDGMTDEIYNDEVSSNKPLLDEPGLRHSLAGEHSTDIEGSRAEVPSQEPFTSFGSSILTQARNMIVSTPSNHSRSTSRIVYNGPGLDYGSVKDSSDEMEVFVNEPLQQEGISAGSSRLKRSRAAGRSESLHSTIDPLQGTACPSCNEAVSEKDSKLCHPDRSLEHQAIGPRPLTVFTDDSLDNNKTESVSEGDQSSLGSHDPDDEDAEPEWLLSDQED